MARVYVECSADEKLVILVLQIRRLKDVEHCGNKSGVAKKLEESTKVLGFMDEDPLSPQLNYITRLNLIEGHGHTQILKDERGNTVVLLSPRIEEWVEDCILRELSEALKRKLQHRHPWIGTSDFEEYFHSSRLKSLEDIIIRILNDSGDNRIKTLRRLLSAG